MELFAVYTTLPSRDEATCMARTLVERRLAACAQICEIESFYRWQGEVCNDTEYRVLFKTTDAQREALQAAIAELHSYELPAIHAVALAHVEERYRRWIAAGSSGDATPPDGGRDA